MGFFVLFCMSASLTYTFHHSNYAKTKIYFQTMGIGDRLHYSQTAFIPTHTHRPEERDVHVVPSSNIWCTDVVVPEDEGDEDVVQVTAMQRQVNHGQAPLQVSQATSSIICRSGEQWNLTEMYEVMAIHCCGCITVDS